MVSKASEGARPHSNRAAERGSDLWPRTTRLLPWMLAGFLALVFLVPINGVNLKVNSPVDPKIDRVALLLIVGVWGTISLLRKQLAPQYKQRHLFFGAALLFVATACLSILLNFTDISRADLFSLALNRIALLCAFLTLTFFAVSAMRPGELANFATFLVILAVLTAIGVIWERRTGFNVFYEFIGQQFHHVAVVAPSPTVTNPDPLLEDRKTIVGPTEHGLAVSTMLAMTIPFALVGFTRHHGTKRWLYALAMGLIMAAILSTERKTGVIAPLAAGLVFAAYRPRAAVRLVPLLVVLAMFIKVAAPGALSTVFQLNYTFESTSSSTRFDDYAASSPQFLAHPLLGSGYGTRDISDVTHVRILDNEYLETLLTIGLIGAAIFLGTILSVMALGHRVIRSGERELSDVALAASGSCAVFLVASFLFDSMSFAEVPYVFFFVAAIATVATRTRITRADRAADRRDTAIASRSPELSLG